MIAFWEQFASQAQSIEDTLVMINSLFLVIIVLKIAYQGIFIHLYGATLGKMLAKTMVLNMDGFDRPSLLTSLNRAMVRIVSEIFFYVGFVWAFINNERQTWHDKVARTIVISVA
jgi:uncharacterized RDD family membrane protein YckC